MAGHAHTTFAAADPAPHLHAATWYAAQTCSRHEKRVAEYLAGRGIESFLPLYVAQRRWADRKARVELPLFPGYLFVHIPLAERLRVLELPGVVRLVSSRGQALAIGEAEIESLRQGLRAGGKAEPHPFLKIGERVHVLAGPFAGCSGILLRKKDSLRVVVSLDIIMRSVAVEVDACDIETSSAN
ncbi:MAG TPA: UpxY family transcription antiterminator [Terriglobales bacterium]|nr:UpxY family transcription antiterminator [Terriglobales bacterium]